MWWNSTPARGIGGGRILKRRDGQEDHRSDPTAMTRRIGGDKTGRAADVEGETLMAAIFLRLYCGWWNYFDCRNNIDQVLLVLWGHNDLLAKGTRDSLGVEGMPILSGDWTGLDKKEEWTVCFGGKRIHF